LTRRIEGKNSAHANRLNGVEIINRQRSYPVDAERWQRFTARALRAIDRQLTERAVTIAFVGDRRMRELNQRFRGINRTTDVLSFPAEPAEFEKEELSPLGDVIISMSRAARQAAENNLTLERETEQLILHGLLHLCGYDHEQDDGEMNRLELTLRRRLRI
jgi:probable rRNA maturation factor